MIKTKIYNISYGFNQSNKTHFKHNQYGLLTYLQVLWSKLMLKMFVVFVQCL